MDARWAVHAAPYVHLDFPHVCTALLTHHGRRPEHGRTRRWVPDPKVYTLAHAETLKLAEKFSTVVKRAHLLYQGKHPGAQLVRCSAAPVRAPCWLGGHEVPGRSADAHGTPRDSSRDGARDRLSSLTMMRAGGVPVRCPVGASAWRMYATRAGAESQGSKQQAQRRGRDRPRWLLPRGPLPPYREWLKGDAERFRYPTPGQGPHWIGTTPFPLNPAFHPPPPVHQNVRDDMWKLHTENPQQWTVRSLSNKFRLSLERTESVLRLKALEEEFVQEVRTATKRVSTARMRQTISLEDMSWLQHPYIPEPCWSAMHEQANIQGKPLQTELQRHMERLLGARPSFTVEARPVPTSTPHSPRGAPYEELSEGTDGSVCIHS